MRRSTLKVIACTAMAISHFGCIFHSFLPAVLVDLLYYAGRISFPIFAYLITEGWCYTTSKKRYMRRLLFFAILSQIPYMLAVSGNTVSHFELNVLFTLFLGTCVLWIADIALNFQGPFRYLILFLSLIPVSLGFCFDMDFGWGGILCIGFMGLSHNKSVKLCALVLSMGLIYLADFSLYYGIAFLFTLPAVILLYFYDGSFGRVKYKYLFYLFYPAHLLVLYCIYSLLC